MSLNTKSKLRASDLTRIFEILQDEGYVKVGPIIRDNAVVYDTIETIEELPIGWTDEQEPASYRLKKRDDDAYFGFHAAPQSWKRFLYPPRRKLFSVTRDGKSLDVPDETGAATKYAFVGVRPCELSAIIIQDKVFGSNDYRDDSYISLRKNLFLIAVNCSDAGATCFCTSMKTGPKAVSGFDLSLTEVLHEGEHYFLIEAGSELGVSVLGRADPEEASPKDIETADAVSHGTESRIKKRMETEDLPRMLSEHLDHPRWDDVAKRCLTCGNCTMVCPTCFCSTVEDVTDLAGHTAERARRWDSCFTVDFSKVAGGNFRISPKSRYRQWLTHKLSSWVEQFGVSGCVGCGRCITWCPAGIDITAEVQAIRGAETQQPKGA